ncbi:hypothetical protein BU25DRAFT_304968, partial [Macroventuria anomochaeta]
KRLICRLYEPLVLLFTLGYTQEDYIPVRLPTEEETLYLPLRTTRRKFLEDLAFVCDYDTGHDTMTAIGMQSKQKHHVLWIASHTSPNRRIIAFARKRLADMKQILACGGIRQSSSVEGFITSCIEFAAPQIRKDMGCLLSALHKCKDLLSTNYPEEVSGLVEWLRTWVCQRTLTDFCRSAYESQGSRYIHTLARLSIQTRESMHRNDARSPFDVVRHHMRQLGRRFQAAKALLTYGSRLSELKDEVQLCAIDTPSESKLPPVDMSTTFDSIARRMMPDNSSDLHRCQHALETMNQNHGLFEHFLHNYKSGDAKPYVHAGIQVLDQFHTRQFLFAGDDSFIACSRPVCLSCLVYFKSHPGRFVEPVSDYNICLNWRPSVLDTEAQVDSEKDQREALDNMNKRIRKEAIHQM